MGILSETLKKHKEESNSAVQSSDIAEEQLHAVSVGKEIDWEERHFQICLALLSGSQLKDCGCVYNLGLMPRKVIETADKMVELLKEHYNGMF